MSESITDLLREEAVIIEAEGATGESVDLLIDAADEITTLRRQLAESEARVAELEGFDFDGWYDKHQSLFRDGAGKSDLRAAYKQGYRDSHPQPAQEGSVPEGWRECLAEMVQAMHDYEMSVDEGAPYKHRAMMDRAHTLLSTTTTPQPAQQGSVPDYVNEALQRLIENGGNLGPASREDALVVARYRRELLATPQPEGDGRLQRLTGHPKTTR